MFIKKKGIRIGVIIWNEPTAMEWGFSIIYVLHVDVGLILVEIYLFKNE